MNGFICRIAALFNHVLQRPSKSLHDLGSIHPVASQAAEYCRCTIGLMS